MLPHKLGPRVLSHCRWIEAPHCPPSSRRRHPPPFLAGWISLLDPFGRQCRPTVAGYGSIRRTNRLQIRGGRTPWRGSSSASPRFPFFHSEMNPSSSQSVALELTTEMDVRLCSSTSVTKAAIPLVLLRCGLPPGVVDTRMDHSRRSPQQIRQKRSSSLTVSQLVGQK